MSQPPASGVAGVARGLVSVMMPAFNAERFVARAVGSLLAQELAAWELIVVDDGSSDATGAILAGFDDPRIAVIRQSNRGEAASRNVALRHARGEYLAFLDADDEFLPPHLAAAVAHLEAHPEHAGVYTDGFYVTGEGEPIATLSSRRPAARTGRLLDAVVRASNTLAPPLSVVLRREHVVRHRLGFDEGIVVGPDWDFFRQFAETGDFGYVDRATCLYRVHDANISARTDRRRRRADAARCRAKAVRSAGFARCPPDVRAWVFHDLLLDCLADEPGEQRGVVEWGEFRQLPRREQARLLRLVAADAILRRHEPAVVREWWRRWRELRAGDARGQVLHALYKRSPRICRVILAARRAGRGTGAGADPYEDLRPARRARGNGFGRPVRGGDRDTG